MTPDDLKRLQTIAKFHHLSHTPVRKPDIAVLARAILELFTELADKNAKVVLAASRMRCTNCGYHDEAIEFVPSDGKPADFICPKCNSLDVFAHEPM